MTKEKIIKKLTSRKFILSLITLLAGVAIALGADENTVKCIAGAAVALIGAVVYCVTEGKIDFQALERAEDQIENGEAIDDGE